MSKNTHHISPKAFTLVEMLISISIFMIFVALAGTSYTALASANRKANETQKIYREVRHVFDTLATELRSGTLDYSCIETTSVDTFCAPHVAQVLGIVQENGLKRSLFRFDPTHKRVLLLHQIRSPFAGQGTNGSSLWLSEENEWQPLNSAHVPIEEFSFSTFPNKNPYDPHHAAEDSVQWQPSVTIILNAGGSEFRTTYSSRSYGHEALYAS